MKKFQVIIRFTMDEDFRDLIPEHRQYINNLIGSHRVEYYSVSMESQRCWMVVNAAGKFDVDKMLGGSPLYRYWQYEIEELFVYDAQSYRLPGLMMN